MDLVGQRDPEHGLVCDLGQTGQIRRLALAPRPRVLEVQAVRARLDDRSYLTAKLGADALEQRSSAAVLNAVVQQRGDRRVSSPPSSSTSPATIMRCAVHGICVPSRRWPPCTAFASAAAAKNWSVKQRRRLGHR